MSKHTPGPWTVDGGEPVGVADVVTDDFIVASDCLTEDAHLIAAAPEMYEALTRLVDAKLDLGDHWAMVADAIAKAEGWKVNADSKEGV